MPTPAVRTRYIERILQDASGRRFRVIFAVSIVDGTPSARIISAQPISDCAGYISGSVSDTSFCLPCARSSFSTHTSYLIPRASVVSPYFSLEFLITSQPTRAPSYN